MRVGANHIEKFIIIKDIVDDLNHKDKLSVTRHVLPPFCRQKHHVKLCSS